MMGTPLLSRLSLLLSVYAIGLAPLHAKLGENLPQLIKRYGNRYEVEGHEEGGDLRVKFRSDTISVDVLMGPHGNEPISITEIYYLDQPLQPDGQPPEATMRDVMATTAPYTKWSRIQPVGSQKAAFASQEGSFLVTVLPPNCAVIAGATFTLIVARVDTRASEAKSSQPHAVPSLTETPTGKNGSLLSSQSRSQPSVTTGQPSPTVRPKTGRLVARGVLPFAVSEPAYDRMASYLRAGDEGALEQLRSANLVAFLKPGTPVRIVESRGFVIYTKEKIQIIGTAVEVWVQPEEVIDESELPNQVDHVPPSEVNNGRSANRRR